MLYENTLLITGANRGIGLEYVRQYAAEGWYVIACCRAPEQADALQLLAKQHTNIKVCALDVADFDQIEALGRKLVDQPIQLLINNAGIYPESSFRNIDYAKWMDAFKVNAMSTMKLAEVFIPQLVKAGNAKLVAMTSKMGSIDDNTSGGEYLYRSSKTALNMVMKSLALDLNKYGVSVAVLHPGWVRTDMGQVGGQPAKLEINESTQGILEILERAIHYQTSHVKGGEEGANVSNVTQSYEFKVPPEEIENKDKLNEFISPLESNNFAFVSYDGSLLQW